MGTGVQTETLKPLNFNVFDVLVVGIDIAP
jgi:hypothetical protein